MNDISFGSIQNLSIAKKMYRQFGHYPGFDGSVKYGEKTYLELPIRFDLVDDEAGDHFSQFVQTLDKCRPCYKFNCVDHKHPYHLDMYMKQFNVADECGDIVVSNFRINNYDIMLDEPQVLPLFTFMAKITRDMLKIPDLSSAKRMFIEHFNKSVAQSAEEFIENM